MDPSTEGSLSKRLVSFVDYSNAAMLEEDVVLIRVGFLFIQYNRAKDYNVDNPVADKVTITEAYADDNFSYALAALAQGETYTYAGFDAVGNALIVQVCAMTVQEQQSSGGSTTTTPPPPLDYSVISIHVHDGVQESSCPPGTGQKSAAGVANVQLSDPVLNALSVGLICLFVLTLCRCLDRFCGVVVCCCCCCCRLPCRWRRCGKPWSHSAIATKSATAVDEEEEDNEESTDFAAVVVVHEEAPAERPPLVVAP